MTFDLKADKDEFYWTILSKMISFLVDFKGNGPALLRGIKIDQIILQF